MLTNSAWNNVSKSTIKNMAMAQSFNFVSTKFSSEQYNIIFKVVGLLYIVNLNIFVTPRRIHNSNDVDSWSGNCIYSGRDFIFPNLFLLRNYYSSQYKKSLVPKYCSVNGEVGLGLSKQNYHFVCYFLRVLNFISYSKGLTKVEVSENAVLRRIFIFHHILLGLSNIGHWDMWRTREKWDKYTPISSGESER
jgi:hypothetical protein